MEEEPIPCPRCAELARLLAVASQPDSVDTLPGLTEVGRRNRDHQARERIAKAKLDIERHERSIHGGKKYADGVLSTS